MDVDGTLTDGKIYMSDNGEFVKAFNIKDGYGIHELLPKHGITPIIITGRKSEILRRRCEEIGIKYLYQGISDKISKLAEVLLSISLKDGNQQYEYESVAYIGDDLNDIDCMKKIKAAGGFVGCPKDAVDEVIHIADFVSDRNGGEGAVREYIEWIIKTNDKF